jgi:hypothetical protein
MNIATPDLIRNIATFILAQYPEGIKQSELLKLTEVQVAQQYRYNKDHTIRNSLWDLEVKFPELVIKKKLSPRNAVLYPSDKLMEQKGKLPDGFVKEVKSPFEAHIEGQITRLKSDEKAVKKKMSDLSYKVVDISRFIDFVDVDELINLDKFELQYLSVNEIEAIYSLKVALEQLRKSRNIFVHHERLRTD